jgi:hypothetical protein
MNRFIKPISNDAEQHNSGWQDRQFSEKSFDMQIFIGYASARQGICNTMKKLISTGNTVPATVGRNKKVLICLTKNVCSSFSPHRRKHGERRKDDV